MPAPLTPRSSALNPRLNTLDDARNAWERGSEALATTIDEQTIENDDEKKHDDENVTTNTPRQSGTDYESKKKEGYDIMAANFYGGTHERGGPTTAVAPHRSPRGR